MTEPKSNYGMVLIPQGKDAATLVSHLDPQSEERPRLSLSCHGDKSDANLVFKAVKATLQKPSATVKRALKAMLKGDASPNHGKVIRKTVEKEHQIAQTKEKLEKLEKEKAISEREAQEAEEINRMRKAELKGINAEDMFAGGATGHKGKKGSATGHNGKKSSATGAKSATGPKAATSAKGAGKSEAATGAKAATGATGAKASTGATGAKASTGATGAKASTGAKAATGCKKANHAHRDSGPCETEPSNAQGPEAYEKMQIVPQTLKPKVVPRVLSATGSDEKKQPAATAASGMTGSATGVTGGATASATGSAKDSGKKNRRFNIDSSNYAEDDSKKVKPSIKVAKKKNSTNSSVF